MTFQDALRKLLVDNNMTVNELAKKPELNNLRFQEVDLRREEFLQTSYLLFLKFLMWMQKLY